MARENWKDVIGFEGRYQVSDLGNVRRLDRWIQHTGKAGRGSATHDHFLRGGPCKFWIGNDGYPQVNLNKNGKGKIVRLHVLVLETFIGPRPTGYEACHINGKPEDNRLCNLRWDTSSSNKLDRIAHGTSNRGARHGMSKLTEAQVKLIRLERNAGKTYSCIAEELNLPACLVFPAAVGHTWGWLKDPPPCPMSKARRTRARRTK
jgi:hypothetical protein